MGLDLLFLYLVRPACLDRMISWQVSELSVDSLHFADPQRSFAAFIAGNSFTWDDWWAIFEL